MKKYPLVFVLLLLTAVWGAMGSVFAQKISPKIPNEWLTYYEKSGYTQTPRYDETVAFCRKLAKASPWIKVTTFGKSPGGRDLILVIASKDKAFTPDKAKKSGKSILLIQNGIHAGEIDGKDACLMLLRDIAVTKTKASLLDSVILLVIPIYNVDGHEKFGPFNRINQNGPDEMGWRVTGQNLNLNRDYLKADAPETQAWLRMYSKWLPDFFVDCHVTDGADFQYVVTYTVEDHLNVAEPLRRWMKETYEPEIQRRMDSTGFPLAPYVFFVDDKDPKKGLWGGTTTPRFSTGYTALQNRPGLLIETHMLKPYRARVEGTYHMLEETMRILGAGNRELRRVVEQSDMVTIHNLEDPFPLKFEAIPDQANQTIRFKGIKATTAKSEISGYEEVSYTGEPYEMEIPRFDSVRVTASVKPPVGYFIPRQWQTVIGRLKDHGVAMYELGHPETLDVEVYRFSNPKWQQNPYEGRHPVTYSITSDTERRAYPIGTIYIPVQQRAARVILHALEPAAPDAFVGWGFFDAIFEQKEYAEGYVVEKLAPQWMKDNPKLKIDFEAKLQSDTAFAHSRFARLNYFYKNSPYWDAETNLYPVGRLMKPAELQLKPLTTEQ